MQLRVGQSNQESGSSKHMGDPNGPSRFMQVIVGFVGKNII